MNAATVDSNIAGNMESISTEVLFDDYVANLKKDDVAETPKSAPIETLELAQLQTDFYAEAKVETDIKPIEAIEAIQTESPQSDFGQSEFLDASWGTDTTQPPAADLLQDKVEEFPAAVEVSTVTESVETPDEFDAALDALREAGEEVSQVVQPPSEMVNEQQDDFEFDFGHPDDFDSSDLLGGADEAGIEPLTSKPEIASPVAEIPSSPEAIADLIAPMETTSTAAPVAVIEETLDTKSDTKPKASTEKPPKTTPKATPKTTPKTKPKASSKTKPVVKRTKPASATKPAESKSGKKMRRPSAKVAGDGEDRAEVSANTVDTQTGTSVR